MHSQFSSNIDRSRSQTLTTARRTDRVERYFLPLAARVDDIDANLHIEGPFDVTPSISRVVRGEPYKIVQTSE